MCSEEVYSEYGYSEEVCTDEVFVEERGGCSEACPKDLCSEAM